MMLPVMHGVQTIIKLLSDLATFIWLILRPHGALAAENLFLRKPLAMFQERKLKPRRPDTPFRVALVLVSRLFDGRDALVAVPPRTLVRWHRERFRLFWCWKSRPGRPPIPAELRALIRAMAQDNPSWGKEPIANALLLKLGIRVSPRTVRKYMPESPRGQPRGDQRWSTLLRNHAANSLCERVIGTLRRECLDFLIPLAEYQLRSVLKEWVTHYNQGRPHASIGPGIPDPPPTLPVPLQEQRHRIPDHLRVVAHSVVGGLHHEYGLAVKAA
jgi:transposase InsO family protein